MKGSITVFMSLCLSVCLLFVGTILESARIGLIRSQISRGTEAAMDSLFAGYDGDLFDEFGILLLNIGEWDDTIKIEKMFAREVASQLCLNEDRLVLGGNFFRSADVEAHISGYDSVIEKDGELFARSVLDYMKYRIPVSATADILEKLHILEEGEQAKADLKSLQIQETVLPEDEEIDEEVYQEYETLKEESIIGKIEELKKNGYLALLLPSDEAISAKTTRKSGFPSNYFSGTPRESSNLLADIANNVLYGEYLLQHFSGFTEESKNPILDYELEYILYGYASDRKNLEECINKLLLIREGLNIITIYRDQALKVQADAFAATLIGWTGLAPLVEVVKIGVIGAWAYAEALVDVRTLLSGNPVPLMKKEGEWTLALDTVPELIKGTYLEIGQYEEGPLYEEYLRLLLLTMDEHTKYYRTMDMVQCRMATQKPRFYMNECVYAVEAEIVVEAKPLFLTIFGNTSGRLDQYRFHMNAARMY